MIISKKSLLVPSTHDPALANSFIHYNKRYPQIKIQIPTLPIYHYASQANAKLILEGSLLKFSSPSTFNDPFDMAQELIDFKVTNQNVKMWLRSYDSGHSNKQKKQILDALKEKGVENITNESFVSFNRVKDDFGICCFSEEPHVSLMWSHYADKHKGVAFGFDFKIIDQLDESFMTLRKVQYKSKIEPISFFSRKEEAVEYWLESKSEVWGYEKEVRAIITNRHGCDLFPFNKSCLKEVYFGCRMTKNDIDEVLDLLDKHGYPSIVKKKMILDSTSFTVKAVDM